MEGDIINEEGCLQGCHPPCHMRVTCQTYKPIYKPKTTVTVSGGARGPHILRPAIHRLFDRGEGGRERGIVCGVLIGGQGERGGEKERRGRGRGGRGIMLWWGGGYARGCVYCVCEGVRVCYLYMRNSSAEM